MNAQTERFLDNWLREPGVNRILSTEYLDALWRRAHQMTNDAIPEDPASAKRAFMRWVERSERSGAIARVQRGIYENRNAKPLVHADEAAQHLRPGAVVSMASVLSKIGVLNNPTTVVFAVVPGRKPTNAPGHRTREELNYTKARDVVADTGRTYRFYSMQPEIYSAGELEDRLDPNALCPTATPERAFCDMLHVATNWRYSREMSEVERSVLLPKPYDTDIDELDRDRLHRLAEAMDISDDLRVWLSAKDAVDNDDDEGHSFVAPPRPAGR